MNRDQVLLSLKNELPDFKWEPAANDQNKIYGSFLFYAPRDRYEEIRFISFDEKLKRNFKIPIEFWIKWDEQEGEFDSDWCEPKNTISEMILEIKRGIFNTASIYSHCYARAIPYSLCDWLSVQDRIPYDEDDIDFIKNQYDAFIQRFRQSLNEEY